MADCDLCGRSEVTLSPVSVPSNFEPCRESGTWAGLCARCLELCRSGTPSSVLPGRCALCRRETDGLSSVALERPSLAGPKPLQASLCADCLEACKASKAEPGAAGH